jgi:hypothetical protein
LAASASGDRGKEGSSAPTTGGGSGQHADSQNKACIFGDNCTAKTQELQQSNEAKGLKVTNAVGHTADIIVLAHHL